jgi:formylglycine-generating enzyme
MSPNTPLAMLPPTYRHPLPNGQHLDLVLVLPGTFLMGSAAEDASEREQPEHRVHLSRPYYVGVTPVTQAQWKAVLGGHNPSRFVGDDRPVEQVSWEDIVTGGQDKTVPKGFLSCLPQQLTPALQLPPGYTFRLPTEAEWEYAGKGGHLAPPVPAQKTAAAELYTAFAGSDKLKEVGWYSQNSHEETKACRGKQPNALGLYDMCGNVWEWCQDWWNWDYYQTCAQQGLVVDPLGPEEGIDRVLRGGSWGFSPRYCRLAYRNGDPPTGRFGDIGFRLVLAPSSVKGTSGVSGTE